MSTPFYEVYRQLCKRAGKSDNAVAAEIGLSNSTVTTWKQGALPRRPTLKKVADYFGVTDEYLMGTTLEAQIDITEGKLQHMQTVLDFLEPEEQEEVERQIETLEKRHRDLCAARDSCKEKTPAPEGEQENPDIRMIARAGKKMTPEQAENLRKYAQFMFPEAFNDNE